MKIILKKSYKIIKTLLVVIIVMITASLIIMKLMGETPSLFGYNFYLIASGSMEPSLQTGDIILSKKVDNTELKISDVVTYQGESGELKGKLITHQIVKMYEEDGEKYIVTKGTANSIEDPAIKEDQVVSVMKTKLPFMGQVLKVINTPLGFLVLIILPLAILLVNEIVALINAFKTDKEEQNNEKNKT